MTSPDKMKLPGFSWKDKIRPARYSDIFIRFREEKPKGSAKKTENPAGSTGILTNAGKD